MRSSKGFAKVTTQSIGTKTSSSEENGIHGNKLMLNFLCAAFERSRILLEIGTTSLTSTTHGFDKMKPIIFSSLTISLMSEITYSPDLKSANLTDIITTYLHNILTQKKEESTWILPGAPRADDIQYYLFSAVSSTTIATIPITTST